MSLADARIHRDSPIPVHFQVRQILSDLVVAGEWRPGDKIPAEIEIAGTLGVSKMTVNKAILALTASGIFFRDIGRGTFVAAVPISGNARPAASEASGATSAARQLHVITVGPAERVADNEYICELLLAMRCSISPLKAALSLRQVRGDSYATCWREDSSDGWLLIAPRQDDVPGLRALAATGAPAVVVGASWQGSALPCVDSDNREGAALAVAHLADLRHRDIALLYADPDASNTLDRIQGFEAALHACGLPFRADWMLDAGDSLGIVAPVRERLRHWLRQPDRPTAFLAAGPFLACILLEIAREADLRVPADLSIVGFDDPTALASVSPALTTVRQPLAAMGREAMSCLERMPRRQSQETTAQRLFLPCQLRVRESTAPP